MGSGRGFNLLGYLAGAEEVAFADVDAIVAQDGVGGGVVEIEVRQHVVKQERLALEVGFLVAALECHGTCVAAINLRGAEALQEGQGAGDARLQFGEGGFVVGVARCVNWLVSWRVKTGMEAWYIDRDMEISRGAKTDCLGAIVWVGSAPLQAAAVTWANKLRGCLGTCRRSGVPPSQGAFNQ